MTWRLRVFREHKSNNTAWSLACWFRTLKVFFSCIIFLRAWAPRSTLRLSLDISVTRLAKNCHFLISKTKSHKRPPSTLVEIYINVKSWFGFVEYNFKFRKYFQAATMIYNWSSLFFVKDTCSKSSGSNRNTGFRDALGEGGALRPHRLHRRHAAYQACHLISGQNINEFREGGGNIYFE